MKLREHVEVAMKSIRSVKEDHVRRVGGLDYDELGKTDVQTILAFIRGDETVAIMQVASGRDHMVAAARAGAGLFSADVVVTSIETWHRTADVKNPERRLDKHPITGAEWSNGDAEALVMADPKKWLDDGTNNGLVQGSLLTQGVNRAGDYYLSMSPYVIKGEELTWTEQPILSDDKDVSTGGPLVDAMLEAMTLPPATVPDLTDELAAEGFTLDDTRSVLDCMAVQALGRWAIETGEFGPFLMLLLQCDPADERRAQIIEHFAPSEARMEVDDDE